MVFSSVTGTPTGAPTPTALRKDGSVWVPAPGEAPRPVAPTSSPSVEMPVLPPIYSADEDEEWQQLIEASRLSVISRQRELEEERAQQRKTKLKLIMDSVKVCKDLTTGFYYVVDSTTLEILEDPLMLAAIKNMGLSVSKVYLATKPGEPSQTKVTFKKASK